MDQRHRYLDDSSDGLHVGRFSEEGDKNFHARDFTVPVRNWGKQRRIEQLLRLTAVQGRMLYKIWVEKWVRVHCGQFTQQNLAIHFCFSHIPYCSSWPPQAVTFTPGYKQNSPLLVATILRSTCD